jgi:hypothetical protein
MPAKDNVLLISTEAVLDPIIPGKEILTTVEHLTE